ncbi:MAG: SDR family NAD(P)-dependent oxidoreductase, partial [Spirochaetota bacterium]
RPGCRPHAGGPCSPWAATERLAEEADGGVVHGLRADLSSLRSVRDLAADVETFLDRDHSDALNAVVNSAATVSSRHMTTRDGFELQFVVNHLAPFLLSALLLPLMRDGAIVNVTSGSHRRGVIHWNDLQLRRRYSLLRAYEQSKLANLIVSYELDRRIDRSRGLRCYAFDPGLVDTSLGEKQTSGACRASRGP